MKQQIFKSDPLQEDEEDRNHSDSANSDGTSRGMGEDKDTDQEDDQEDSSSGIIPQSEIEGSDADFNKT